MTFATLLHIYVPYSDWTRNMIQKYVKTNRNFQALSLALIDVTWSAGFIFRCLALMLICQCSDSRHKKNTNKHQQTTSCVHYELLQECLATACLSERCGNFKACNKLDWLRWSRATKMRNNYGLTTAPTKLPNKPQNILLICLVMLVSFKPIRTKRLLACATATSCGTACMLGAAGACKTFSKNCKSEPSAEANVWSPKILNLEPWMWDLHLKLRQFLGCNFNLANCKHIMKSPTENQGD